jgi:hypothetical protein
VRGRSGVRPQGGAAATGRGRSGDRPQRGAAAPGRRCNWARPQLSAAGAGCRCSGVGMPRGTNAAGSCCSGAVPQLPTAPFLSQQICVERGTEKMREASLISLDVLYPSPSHTSSPRLPKITVPLSLLPSPPLRLFLSLWTFSISSSTYLPLPSSAISLFFPFPVSFSFPVSLHLSPPPLSRYPCDPPPSTLLSFPQEAGRARG